MDDRRTADSLRRWTACERLNAFYHHLDRSAYDACTACFALEGSWLRLGREHHGRDAIRAVLNDRPPDVMLLHILSNVHAELRSDDRARVSAYTSVFTHRFEGTPKPPAPLKPLIGIYAIAADMVALDGEWHISRLTMATQFSTPPASGD